jgi:hypothetical protein
MVTILLVVASLALLYGLLQLSETAWQRWRPNPALGQTPIDTQIDAKNVPVVDALAYGITGMPMDTVGIGIGEAIATEMAGETAAIGEAIAPMLESSQHFIAHGAEAIGHAVGEVLSGL